MKQNPRYTIPHDASSANQWILWHKSLKGSYGKKSANEIFVFAWDERKNSNADTTLLRDYMRGQGVDLATGFIGQTADGLNSVMDGIENTLGFAGNTAKVIVLILVVGVGILTYNLAKNPELIGKIFVPSK